MRLLLIVSLLVFATAKAQSPDANGVAFEITKAGLAGDGSFAKYLEASDERRGVYLVGKPISIRCVFRNSGSRPITLSLKDHDQYHGTLPYPQGVQARIEDTNHKVLTVNTVNKEGWWSVFFLSSQMSAFEPGDNITIPPGDKVTRIIPLDEVLKGCDGLPRGLPAGNFVVQLRVFGPDLRIESNPLDIAVAAE